MDANEQDEIMEYSNGTKSVCLCTIIAIFLIIMFIISPLSNFVIASGFGKVIILAILVFALYKNISITSQFSKNIGLFGGEWTNTKTNIVCSYVFTTFIIILIFSVINRFFS